MSEKQIELNLKAATKKVVKVPVDFKNCPKCGQDVRSPDGVRVQHVPGAGDHHRCVKCDRFIRWLKPSSKVKG